MRDGHYDGFLLSIGHHERTGYTVLIECLKSEMNTELVSHCTVVSLCIALLIFKINCNINLNAEGWINI